MFNKTRLFTIVLTSFLTLFSVSICTAASKISRKQITDNLYQVSGAGANSFFLVTEGGVLVVDAGSNPENGKLILSEIAAITPKPIKYLIYSHYHGDHLYGASAFPAETKIIAHYNTLDCMRRIYFRQPHGTNHKLRYPDIVFKDNFTITLGGQKIELSYQGPAHTTSDILTHFVDHKALHIGDLLFGDNSALFIDPVVGGQSQNLLRIYEIIEKYDDITVLYGHAEVTDIEGFLNRKSQPEQLLKDYYIEIERRVNLGESNYTINKNVQFPQHEDLSGYEYFRIDTIKAVHKEIVSLKNEQVRQPFTSGETYPDDPNELRYKLLDTLKHAERIEVNGRPYGLIIPHYIPYAYDVIASGLKQFEGRKPKRIIILCNSHMAGYKGVTYLEYPGAVLDTKQAWKTPLGDVNLDSEFAEKLYDEHNVFRYDAYSHAIHPQISNIIPYLQVTFGNDFKIVPILLGNSIFVGEDLNDDYKLVAAAIEQFADSDDIIIVSNDMSHDYPNEKIYHQIDWDLLHLIEKGDIQGIFNLERLWAEDPVSENKIISCAIDGIKSLMQVHRITEGLEIKRIMYDHRVRPIKNFVGMGSVVFTR